MTFGAWLSMVLGGGRLRTNRPVMITVDLREHKPKGGPRGKPCLATNSEESSLCLGVNLVFEGEQVGHKPGVPNVRRYDFMPLAGVRADKVPTPIKTIIRFYVESLILDCQQMHVNRGGGIGGKP